MPHLKEVLKHLTPKIEEFLPWLMLARSKTCPENSCYDLAKLQTCNTSIFVTLSTKVMQWKGLWIEQTFPILGAYQFIDAVCWLCYTKASRKHQVREALTKNKGKILWDPAHTHIQHYHIAPRAVESFPPFFLCWVSRCLLSVCLKPVKMCCRISYPYPVYQNENAEVQKLFFLQSSFPGLGSDEKNGSTLLAPVESDPPPCSWFLTTGFQTGHLEWDSWWDTYFFPVLEWEPELFDKCVTELLIQEMLAGAFVFLLLQISSCSFVLLVLTKSVLHPFKGYYLLFKREKVPLKCTQPQDRVYNCRSNTKSWSPRAYLSPQWLEPVVCVLREGAQPHELGQQLLGSPFPVFQCFGLLRAGCAGERLC